jgi:hypothetical protein
MSRILRWRKLPKTGSHSFMYDGNRYRVTPNQIVECAIEPIKPFIEEYECLGEITDKGVIPVKEEKEEPKGDITLEVVSRGGGYYNVINPDNPDKPLNDKGLRKKAAYQLAGLEVPKVKRRKS